jgi:D-hydroxyproline dehydrogenase subunit gamma
MFKRLPLSEGLDRKVRISFEGQSLDAREGDSVAAALMAAGESVFRTTPVSSSPRGPYCLMGVCFECLVAIDGRPNMQACMTQVRDGMQVARQRGARSVSEDMSGDSE